MFWIVTGVLGLLALVSVIAEVPPTSWVNGLQMAIGNGSYSPKLTLMILIVSAVGLGRLFGAVFDARRR